MQTVEGAVNTFAVVRSVLREQGVDLSPEGEAFVASAMTNKIRIEPGEPAAAVLIADTEASGEVNLALHLRALLQSESTRHYFMASRSAAPAVRTVSSDHDDQSVKNPWLKEHRNLTRQMLLENTKPELAKRLKAEADHAPAKQRGAGDPSNPFSRAGWNLTKQMQMMRADQELAAHMEKNANA